MSFEPLPPLIRDYLVDVAFATCPKPSVSFQKVVGGTWGEHSFDRSDGRLAIDGTALSLAIPNWEASRSDTNSLFALRNHPCKLLLEDGSSVMADVTNLERVSADASFKLYQWSWLTQSRPAFWVGRITGLNLPKLGNVRLRERRDDGLTTSWNCFCLRGRHTWYLTPFEESVVVIVEQDGASIDRPVLVRDLHALQFTFGGGFRLDYLVGLDARRVSCGAIALGTVERTTHRFRSPVPDFGADARVWLPHFFSLVAASFCGPTSEALLIAVTAYLDSVADHLDGAYLKAQVGLEAFANRIATRDPSEKLLVKDGGAWKRWVRSLLPTVKSHLRDAKHADTIQGKFASAMYAPSGDQVRRVLEAASITVPEDVREEIKMRNYPAHGFLMNAGPERGFDDDIRRLELIQTLIVALVSFHVGYRGPIEGYDRAESGGRIPPDWWPVRSTGLAAPVLHVGERNVRAEAIREAAYYLWLNRSGAAWWDPQSNWLEAERAVRRPAG